MLQSLDYYKAAVIFLVRAKRLKKAAELLRRQALVHVQATQPHGVARCELSAVVLLLAADDYEGAYEACEDAQMRGDGFGGTDEVSPRRRERDAKPDPPPNAARHV